MFRELTNWKSIAANDGMFAFEKAVKNMQPADLTLEVKNSGLRGRGGAGFPTGIKWGFLPNNSWPHYVVANADESEPGTFKDREIMESNPFPVPGRIDAGLLCRAGEFGLCVSAGRILAIGGIFWKRKYKTWKSRITWGEDFRKRIIPYNLNTSGAGAYICGEETALLESLEGKLGQPRLRPPFPAAMACMVNQP